MSPGPGELHLHKCGWSPTINIRQHGVGCGHVFGHEKRTDVTDEVYNRAHLCPVCKAGPWKNVWEQEVEEHWNSLSSEERKEIRDEMVRKDALWAMLDRLFGAIDE